MNKKYAIALGILAVLIIGFFLSGIPYKLLAGIPYKLLAGIPYKL